MNGRLSKICSEKRMEKGRFMFLRGIVHKVKYMFYLYFLFFFDKMLILTEIKISKSMRGKIKDGKGRSGL